MALLDRIIVCRAGWGVESVYYRDDMMIRMYWAYLYWMDRWGWIAWALARLNRLRIRWLRFSHRIQDNRRNG